MIPINRCRKEKTWALLLFAIIIGMIVLIITTFNILKAFGYELGSDKDGMTLFEIIGREFSVLNFLIGILLLLFGAAFVYNPAKVVIERLRG